MLADMRTRAVSVTAPAVRIVTVNTSSICVNHKRFASAWTNTRQVCQPQHLPCFLQQRASFTQTSGATRGPCPAELASFAPLPVRGGGDDEHIVEGTKRVNIAFLATNPVSKPDPTRPIDTSSLPVIPCQYMAVSYPILLSATRSATVCGGGDGNQGELSCQTEKPVLPHNFLGSRPL